MTDNQRAHARVRADKVRVRVANDRELRELYLRDLSMGGVFILSESPKPVGSGLDIELLPPGWAEPLALRGQVVRVADDDVARSLSSVGMGVRLEAPPAWTRIRLEALLAQHGMLKRAKTGAHETARPPTHPPPPPTMPPVAPLGSVPPSYVPAPPTRLPGPLPSAPPLPRASVPPPPPAGGADPMVMQMRAQLEAVTAELSGLRREREELASLTHTLQEQISSRAAEDSPGAADAKLAEAMAAWEQLTTDLVAAQDRIAQNEARVEALEVEAAQARSHASEVVRQAEERSQAHEREAAELREEVERLRAEGGPEPVRRRSLWVPLLLLFFFITLGAAGGLFLFSEHPLAVTVHDAIGSLWGDAPPDEPPEGRGPKARVLPPSDGVVPPVAAADAGASEEADAGTEQPEDAGAAAAEAEPDAGRGAFGVVVVKANRPASIKVDGKLMGRTPRTQSLKLAPGPHEVRFVCTTNGKPKGKTYDVTVVANEQTELKHKCPAEEGDE